MLKNGYSDAEFARLCDIKYTTLKGYFDGKTPGLDNAAKIASAFGKSLDWLYGNDSNEAAIRFTEDTSDHHQAAKTISIPRYEVHAAAGNGAEVLSQEVADYFTVSKDWYARFVPPGSKLGMIEARGDSMEKTIFDGDALIVNFNISQHNIVQGGVFVFTGSIGIRVKRFQIMLDGRLRISSDNERYEPEYISREEAEETITVNAQVLFNVAPLRGFL